MPQVDGISKYVNMPFAIINAVDPDALLLQGAADPTRLAILRQLAAGDGVCACDFTSCCDVAQPTVSHHLKVLRKLGWVRTERAGRTSGTGCAPTRSIGSGRSPGSSRRARPARLASPARDPALAPPA